MADIADAGSGVANRGVGVMAGAVITIGEEGKDIDSCESLKCALGNAEMEIGGGEAGCFKVGVGTSAGEIDSVPDGGDEEESRGGGVNINPLLNGVV